jgi:hypothetical protein
MRDLTVTACDDSRERVDSQLSQGDGCPLP